MTKQRAGVWLLLYQCLAGLGDTSTGWLLIVEPRWTLTLMGVHLLPQPIEFASFVGVFVLGVGLVYLYAMHLPLDAAHAPRWQTVWALTALVRTLVAVFLFVEISSGRMERAWLAVAVFDGTLALIQWIGLTRGWLDFAG
jgi:hypothetical protein